MLERPLQCTVLAEADIVRDGFPVIEGHSESPQVFVIPAKSAPDLVRDRAAGLQLLPLDPRFGALRRG
jgi:hypothetical protein